MRVIQKQAGQILLSIFLAGSCFAADLRATDTLSIATQIASPTDTLRQTYDHWSFIRPSLQSPVCITSNIDSRPLPRLVFGDESAPRRGADEAAHAVGWQMGHHPDILIVSQVVYGAVPTRQDAACQPKIPFQI